MTKRGRENDPEFIQIPDDVDFKCPQLSCNLRGFILDHDEFKYKLVNDTLTDSDINMSGWVFGSFRNETTVRKIFGDSGFHPKTVMKSKGEGVCVCGDAYTDDLGFIINPVRRSMIQLCNSCVMKFKICDVCVTTSKHAKNSMWRCESCSKVHGIIGTRLYSLGKIFEGLDPPVNRTLSIVTSSRTSLSATSSSSSRPSGLSPNLSGSSSSSSGSREVPVPGSIAPRRAVTSEVTLPLEELQRYIDENKEKPIGWNLKRIGFPETTPMQDAIPGEPNHIIWMFTKVENPNATQRAHIKFCAAILLVDADLHPSLNRKVIRWRWYNPGTLESPPELGSLDLYD
jgi:hypothetical protein